jgi:hypothetical protein
VHPHNGYYAGNFSTTRHIVLAGGAAGAAGAAASQHLRVVVDTQPASRAAAPVPAGFRVAA